jgi:hypothetical protein
MNRKERIWFVVLSLGCVLHLSCGRWDLRNRQKQIDSFTRVYTISKKIETACIGTNRSLSNAEIERITASVASGLDGWGNGIRVWTFEDGGAHQYIVVSSGRDGEFDCSSGEPYAALRRVDIRGEFDRDIVFLNGKSVTNAGKDPHSEYPERSPVPGETKPTK